MREPSRIYLANPWRRHKTEVVECGIEADCPIWGNVGNNHAYEKNHRLGDYFTYWSPKSGGAFSLSGTIADNMNTLLETPLKKIKFSSWVYMQNKNGTVPKVLSHQLDEIVNQPRLLTEEKLRLLLLAHAELCPSPSLGLWRQGRVVEGAYDFNFLARAITETSEIDFDWLRDAAIQNGDLEFYGDYTRITPKGMKELQKQYNSVSSDQAFIAMWFNENMDTAYNSAISKAVSDAGYRSYRGDLDISHSDQITNNLIAQIKQSKFLIADFTHGDDGARGSVYFEAGFALGLGLPVLWLIKDDGTSKKHFDTNQYPHIIWKDEDDLRQQLTDAILAHQHIGKGPL